MNIPPIASKQPHPMSIHDDTRIDNYYWLKEREDQAVIDYLNDENAYTEAVLAPVKDFKEQLFQEMKARIKENEESLPYRLGGYYYYSRFEEKGEYPIYCRKKGSLRAKEEIMLDVNEWAKDKTYYSATFPEITDNEEIAAFGDDEISRRIYTLRFKNLRTGEIYPDVIPNTEGGNYAWATDNKTIFYILKDPETLLGYQVWRHELGTDNTQDVLVYEEHDNQYYMGLYRMKSKKYIAIVSDHNGVATEYQLLEASKPTESCRVFLPRQRGHEYAVEHFENKFYVKTNLDNAINFKLIEVAENQQFNTNQWKEVIAHRPEVYLEGLEIFKSHIVLQERKEGLINLRIINHSSKEEHYLNFGEATYTAYTATNPDFDTNVLRFGYTSLTTPSSTFDYNMDSRRKRLKKQQEVLGDFDKKQYISERVYATARDGVKIPISIVYKKGFKKNAKSPLLQYAYGSYGYSIDPTFSSARLSLLNRGFAFAIAHIRGGQEMGRQWYEDGKMFKKINTFTDFIDCSQYLIQHQYSSPEALFAQGGSAGGLLMGAVANLASPLYKGILAAVPFVDVVTTMLDDSIPLTTGEYEEWGNPNNADSYHYMKSYSPYDNVSVQGYCNMLITTGLHDSQVQYWEPAKWIAKLRDMKTDQNQLLLQCDMEAGHGGASGRFKRLHDIALEYVFMLNLLNIRS